MSTSLSGCVRGYVGFLNKWKGSVILAWVVATLLLGFFGAIHLMGSCKNEFESPPGSLSEIAQAKMTSYFGDATDSRSSEILFFQGAANQNLVADGVLKSLTTDMKTYLQTNLEADLYSDLTFEGYYSMLEKGPPFNTTAKSFLSKDGTSSFVIMGYPGANTMKYGKQFLSMVNKFRDDHYSSGTFVGDLQFVGDAGGGVTAVQAASAAAESIERMDMISLPIAFLVLAISLRSLRMLVLPFITLIVGCVVAFGIMGIAAQVITVSSATPAVMMSMLLAISIDYALFLLSRFQEEIKSGEDVDTAVHQMLLHSGHTICGSGFTLALCFVSLLFFPLQLMQSIGLGCIVSVLTAMFVNLTIVPAVLLFCPVFMAGKPEAAVPEAGKRFEETLWFRWADFSASRPALGVVAFFLVSLGVVGVIGFSKLEKSMDTFLMLPRHDMTFQTTVKFGASFSRGQTGPYQLLLVPTKSKTIYDAAFWTDSQNLLAEIARSYEGDSKTLGTIASIMYEYQGQTKPYGQYMPMLLAQFMDPTVHDPAKSPEAAFCDLPVLPQPLRAPCHQFVSTKNCKELLPLETILRTVFHWSPSVTIVDLCDLFQIAVNSTTTPTRSAIHATLTPSEIPGSQAAVDFARKCRSILETINHNSVEAYLVGGTPMLMDAIDTVYERLPVVLAVTMVCCLILIGLLTVSVPFGIMSVTLIFWTIIVVFALGVFVYQDGALGPEAWVCLSKDGGLAWMIPALTFTIILGLGLDYSIFLLLRVCECREKGMSDRDAFVYGVARTGPVITSAGIIMAIAFSGLMMSSIPMLNQQAFLLVTAVLIDTFFIGCLATPAIQTPLGRWNWWPRKVVAGRARSTSMTNRGIDVSALTVSADFKDALPNSLDAGS